MTSLPAKSFMLVHGYWTNLRQFVSNIVDGSYYIAGSVFTSCLLAAAYGSFLVCGGEYETKREAYAATPTSRAFGLVLVLIASLTIVLVTLDVIRVVKQRWLSTLDTNEGP